MNVKLIKRNNDKPSQKLIDELKEKFNLHPVVAELLLSRKIDTIETVDKFLHPKIENFYDPMLLKGMSQAVERIKQSVRNGERIVIYGDYDADGVCATAILSLFLSSIGLEVFPYIPNRVGDGYGLSIESIERIIENCCPDLIITCDCGISGHAEVAHAIDLGVDVIVTDHHEVSDTVPECIVINPKQIDCAYPEKFLCGAGVALKLVHALGGIENAMNYVDLATVATIADLVPLLDENRLIVQLGLKQLSLKKNLGLKVLFNELKIQYPATSGDIAYKVAPRINAAGRMGDAFRAFELLTEKSETRVKEIVKEINDDNLSRKQLCDKLYIEAIADLKDHDLVNNRSLVIYNPKWEKGIMGILAARLSGDFKRPSFVIVGSGDSCKGTCRSVAGINVYELLSSVSDVLIEFGGHSQAAGFSIDEKNIAEFSVRVNEYLSKFDFSLFAPVQEYDLELSPSQVNLELADALECIEPTGNSNTKPLFKIGYDSLTVTPCKSNYMHTNIATDDGLQILAFNNYSQNQFLMGSARKNLIVELQTSVYLGKKSIKSVLRSVEPTELFVNDDIARANFIKTLAYSVSYNDEPTMTFYERSELKNLVSDNEFGTLYIAGCKKSYDEFINSGINVVMHEYLYSTCKNNYTRVIISPEVDENLMLDAYDNVIFLDTPPNYAFVKYINKKSGAKVYVPKTDNSQEFFASIDVSRQAMGRCFDGLRGCEKIQATNVLSFYKQYKAHARDVSISQFIVAVMVFNELKLIEITKQPFSIKLNKGVTSDLNNSLIYRILTQSAN